MLVVRGVTVMPEASCLTARRHTIKRQTADLYSRPKHSPCIADTLDKRAARQVLRQELFTASTAAEINASALRAIELSITGVNSPSCVEDIATALRKVSGVAAVAADTAGALLKVEADRSISVRGLMETVRRLEKGYRAVPYKERTWTWRGWKTMYAEVGAGSAVVLVHGFGGNYHHFRKLAADLSDRHRVLAVDLLGFGESSKPTGIKYDPHLWKDQVVEFIREVVNEPVAIVGNSIGSQVALYAATELDELVKGVCLLNCVGGMNQKGIYQDDWTVAAARPVFAVLEWLLKRRAIANWLFDQFRDKDRIANLLVARAATGLPPPYANAEAVNEELLNLLLRPAAEEGAVDVFVAVFTGDPGPRPEQLFKQLSCPILVAWGQDDPWARADGPLARYFVEQAVRQERLQVEMIPQCGHCPMDDTPELVADLLLPWLTVHHSK